MMAIVFFMGMFLDWLGIVMIVFPIFLPIMDMFGFDRLWIVAVTAVMLQTCFMTPPFGFALFYIKGIVPPSVKIQEIYRGVIPFILIIIAVVILVTVFPQVYISPESGSILIFLLSLPAATCAGSSFAVRNSRLWAKNAYGLCRIWCYTG